MAITSIQVGRGSLLELLDTATYNVDRATLYALVAGVSKEPRLVSMAGRYPAYVGETPTARVIPLVVYAINASETTRRSDLATLLGYLDSTAGLVELRWTEGSTYRYWCSVTEAQADADFSVFTANLVAPNPVKETV